MDKNQLEKWCGAGKLISHCFPSGSVYSLYEQYSGLEANFFNSVLLCEIAIFICCMCLLMDLTIAFLVSLMSVAIVSGGLAGLADQKRYVRPRQTLSPTGKTERCFGK